MTWTLNPGMFSQPLLRLGVFVRGVVVHHQVHLDSLAVLIDGVSVGPLYLAQEGKELLVRCLGLRAPVTCQGHTGAVRSYTGRPAAAGRRSAAERLAHRAAGGVSG